MLINTAPRLRAAFVAAIASFLVVVVVAPAFGHAALVSSSPSDGQRLDGAPDAVVLEFNEPVTTPTGGVRVFNADGDRVDNGDAGRGPSDTFVVASLQPELPDGTYIVTWRAFSADNHPVKGAFVFQVGDGTGVDDSLVAQLLNADSDRPFAIGNTILRWLGYLGVLVAAGAVFFLLLVAPNSPGAEPVVARSVGVASGVALTAALLGLLFQGAEATGLGWSAFVAADVIGDTLKTSFGTSTMLRLVGVGLLLTAAVAGMRAGWRVVALGGAGIALASYLFTGHSAVSSPRPVVLVADAVHLAAVAAWFGGLVLLVILVRPRLLDRGEAAGIVTRFSTVATLYVVLLVGAGLILAWVEVQALRALTSTVYGWTLLAKIALVVVALLIGAYNRRRLVPTLDQEAMPVAAGTAPSSVAAPIEDGDPSPGAWQGLRRSVAVEVALLVVVVAITAVLVNLAPARDAAGIGAPFSTYVDLGEYEVNLVVDPNRAGTNQIHIYLLTEAGRPAVVSEDIELALELPDEEINAIDRVPFRAGPGHWLLTGPELALSGPWLVTIRVPVGDFEVLTVQVPVVVNP